MANSVKKRSYSSPVRQEQAALTRRRILDAAGELFAARGYARTTVKAVAERANVAVDTVYAVFGTKARILTALIDARLAPEPGVDNVMDRPEARAVQEGADPRAQLDLFALDMASVSTRVRPVYEILRTAAAVEPAMAAVHAEMDGYRLENMRRFVDWLGRDARLRVSPDRAAEIVWALASPDVARMLCDARGWTEADHAAWLQDTLARTLLDDDPPAGRRARAR
ncbi:MAG: TetR/AcrR family transcriptional regulator [Acidimicrobiia bacterium]